MFDGKASWSVNSIKNEMGVRTRFRWYRPMESNSIVDLCHLNESNCKFNQPIFKISSGWIKIFRKSFICLSLYTLPSILSMEFEAELCLRFSFSISLVLLFYFLGIEFKLSIFLPIFRFVGEFWPFLHLGFTYTTYITVKVKSKFII